MSPALEVGSFIPWYGQNKGLGRGGQNRLELKQVLIRNITVLGNPIFSMCLNAPRKPFWEGGGRVITVRFLDNKLFVPVYIFSSAGPSRHPGGGFRYGLFCYSEVKVTFV